MKNVATAFAIAATALLTACGGGGGSDVTDTPSITIGSTITGTIDSATDVDAYKLPVAREGTLTIAISGNANPEIRVLDASGNEIPGREGSYIVDITKDVLAKGRHVIVEFFGGVVGESYSGTTSFEAAQTDGTGDDRTRQALSNPILIIGEANTRLRSDLFQTVDIVGVAPGTKDLSSDSISILDLGNRAQPYDFSDDEAEYNRLPPAERVLHRLSPARVLTDVNGIYDDKVSLPRTTTDLSTLQMPAGTPSFTGTAETDREYHATWGRWHLAGIDFFKSSADPSGYSIHSEGAMANVYGYATSLRDGLAENAAATYRGQAKLWDSRHPYTIESARTEIKYRNEQGHSKIDVRIDRIVRDDIVYSNVGLVITGTSNFLFERQTSTGYIGAHVYGPKAEEIGGIFEHYEGGKRSMYPDIPELEDIGFQTADNVIVGAFSTAKAN